jgi:translocation and assembly module TamA
MRWAMQSLLGLLIALHITWAAAAPAFVLNVVAPDDVQPTLARHLDIQRFANLPDLDANELQRLVADVPTHARSLLGALGYFSPHITTQLDDAQQPPTVTVTVDPGAPTTVGSVSLTVRPHPALSDTTASRKPWRRLGRCPVASALPKLRGTMPKPWP